MLHSPVDDGELQTKNKPCPSRVRRFQHNSKNKMKQNTNKMECR